MSQAEKLKELKVMLTEFSYPTTLEPKGHWEIQNRHK